MEDLEIVLAALFVSVAGLTAIARWLSVPYPIPLVLGGLVLGLLPGIPEIELEPDPVPSGRSSSSCSTPRCSS